jgi:hypothetical protein
MIVSDKADYPTRIIASSLVGCLASLCRRMGHFHPHFLYNFIYQWMFNAKSLYNDKHTRYWFSFFFNSMILHIFGHSCPTCESKPFGPDSFYLVSR